MSVGAVSTLATNSVYAGIPGAASLGLATPSDPTTSTTSSAGTTSSTGSTPSITNTYTDIPGFDALGLNGDPNLAPTTTNAASNSSVAGFDALGIQGNGQATTTPSSTTGSTTAATGTTGQNVYQTAYDGIIQASNAYLQQSLENPNPNAQIPLYAAGSSASQFASLQNTLSAISTGLQNGLFQGTGVNTLA